MMQILKKKNKKNTIVLIRTGYWYRSPSLCDVDNIGQVNDVDFSPAAYTSETFGVHTYR